MILNLLNTIAITLGIGTSVNNTNFNYEKKSHRNANEQNISYTYTYGETANQSLHINSTEPMYYYKYLVPRENKTDLYTNIRDTVYTKRTIRTNGYTNNEGYMIYEITNYYNTYIQFEASFKIQVSSGTTINYIKQLANVTDINLDEYYNMTLTNGIQNRLDSLMYTIDEHGYLINTPITTDTGSGEYEIEIATGNVRLQPNEKIQFYFYTYQYALTSNTESILKPKSIQYWGTVIIPQQNIEIIDVPGLMFTVLTLPFSFISQAFNLTIFPGTNYQINFSNLFLTIIAIFILLWLIKHIFK